MNGPFMERKATEMSMEDQKKLYVRPAYFDKLYRPGASCVIGERGSGKTTALRHLEYEINEERQLNAIAVYYRFETAAMRSMLNKSMDEDLNIDSFTQILVAIFCKKIIESYYASRDVSEKTVESIFDAAKDYIEDEIPIDDDRQISELVRLFERIRSRTFSNIRNGKYQYLFDSREMLIRITEALQNQYGEDFKIYLLLDEYENLTELQQKVINSMLKDAPYQIVYKICLRPEGFWTKNTLAKREYLMVSHDYEELDYIEDIMGADGERSKMLRSICSIRLAEYFKSEGITYSQEALDIDNYLEHQDIEAEVENLKGKDDYENTLREKIIRTTGNMHEEQVNSVDGLINLQIVDIMLEKGNSFEDIFMEYRNNSDKYQNWIHNYKINALFIILEECKESKAYGGIDMIAYLANFNIRTVLAILDNIFSNINLNDTDLSSEGMKPVLSIRHQSEAIKYYSDLMVDQIGYVPYFGYEERNMMNALGEAFHQFLTDKRASKFEANNFMIIPTKGISKEERKKITRILKVAVMWGLLIQIPANKIKGPTNYSSDGRLYIIHPIFSVHYKISYRRKQKIDITDRVFNEILSPVNGTYLRKLFNIGKNDNIEGQLSFI